MLKNLIKLNTGRTNIKIIATILVITLTFANFALLGTYIGETLALDTSPNIGTNVDNVKFIAYLDETDMTKNHESADINSEELSLYVSVAVQNEGKLENAKISFENSNFEAKENGNKKEKELETVVYGNESKIRIPIVARKDAKYKLDLLNMTSKIVLTGDYIYENGNVETVNTEKEIQIEWNTSSVTNDDLVISQEVITNRIYNIEGNQKRVIQILVKESIKDNKAPLNQATIEIDNPIENPEEVKVAVKKLNGKAASYTSNTSKTTINILNNPNEDNKIAWNKNSSDEFIVTYIYDEDVEITPFVSNVNIEAKVYGTTNEGLEQTNELSLDTIEANGEIVLLEKNIPNELYKGFMYLEEDTNFETRYEMFVSYSDAIDNLELEDFGEAIDSDVIASYFKETKINKLDAQKLLGAEGTIKVFNSEDLSNAIMEINLSEEMQEDYYIITYGENVEKIIIQTSKPVKEGKLEIINQKTLRPLDLSKVEETTTISSRVSLIANKEENSMLFDLTKTGEIELKEPVLTMETSLDKETLSTQVEDTLRITEILASTKAQNKLFKNPTLYIDLPQEFTNVQIENIDLIDEELNIESSKIENNRIEVKINGEQTKYGSNALGGPNVVIDLKLKTDNFMANRNVEIKTTCINDDKEEVAKAEQVTLMSKNGIISKNTITVGENTVEQANNDNVIIRVDSENEIANINTRLINNYGANLQNISFVGTVKTNLLGAVTTNINDAVITYSEDLITWNAQVEDFSKVKAFKIETESEFVNSEELQINYQANIKEFTSEDAFSKVELQYDLNGQNLSKKMNYTILKGTEEVVLNPVVEEQEQRGVNTNTITYNVEIGLKSKTTTGVLHEGQIVTYIVSAKNTGDTIINNAKLQYIIPEGTTCVELKYKDGYDISIENIAKGIQSWDIETLRPGETFSKEVTIKINKGTTEIVNQIKLINNQSETAAQLISDPIEIETAEIEVVTYKRGSIDDVLKEGDVLDYFIDITNQTQDTLRNIIVEVSIPENTVYDEDNIYSYGWSFNESKNKIYYNIEELQAGATQKLIFSVNIDKLETEETNIENTVIVKTENEEKYESNSFTVGIKQVKMQLGITSRKSSRGKRTSRYRLHNNSKKYWRYRIYCNCN